MSRRLLLLAIALAMLLAWLAFRQHTATTRERASRVPEPVDDRVDEPPLTSNAPASLAGASEREAAVEILPTRIALRGSVSITDDRGRPLPCPIGTLTWELSLPDGTRNEAGSTIVDDQWTLDVPLAAVLRPATLICGRGELAQIARVAEEVIPAREAQGHIVHAVVASGVRLHVIDAVTLAELEDVQLVIAPQRTSVSLASAVPALALLSGADDRPLKSPIALPPTDRTRIGWVRAPERAWTRFAFTGTEGELTVALSPGAEASVLVTHLPEDAVAPVFRVYADIDSGSSMDLEPLLERRIADGVRYDLRGLRPGRAVFVVAPFPAATFIGPRLGAVETTLVAGERRDVTLDLESAEMRRSSGTLRVTVVPAVDGPRVDGRMRVEIERADGIQTKNIEEYVARFEATVAGAFTKDCEHLAPGDYLVTLVPSAVARRVSVVGGAVTDVELALDGLTTVTVKVLDAADGRALLDDELLYRPASSRRVTSWSEVHARREDGCYRFRCAPGRIRIAADPTGYVTIARELDVGSEPVECELRLERERLISIDLRAMQGQTAVPLPSDFWTAVRVVPVAPTSGMCEGVQPRPNAARGHDPELDTAGAQYSVTSAGRYRIEFPALDRIRCGPPLEIEVSPGGLRQDFEVELR